MIRPLLDTLLYFQYETEQCKITDFQVYYIRTSQCYAVIHDMSYITRFIFSVYFHIYRHSEKIENEKQNMVCVILLCSFRGVTYYISI